MHLLLTLLLAVQSADSAHLVIVATTDVHGRVLGWDYGRDAEAPGGGGLARAASIIETLRAQHPGRVVLLDAGDLLQGNPFATLFAAHDRRQPHPVVDALNALQYDVATPGNHEFDFGLDLLRRAARDATYRYVSANVEQAGAPLFPPVVLLQRAGVRVGVTGFTTPGVMVWDRAQLAAGQTRVRRVAEAAPAALARLEREGADLRVVLIHAGLDGTSSYDTAGVGPENDAAVLAAVTPKPHLVIVGHSHREIRDTVIDGVHFVQPKNWAQSLAVVHVWLVKIGSRWRVTSIRGELRPLGTVPELPRFARRMDAAHEAVRLWAGTPLGAAGPGFDGRYARAQDTPLLDFVNEVQRRRSGAQLSAAAAFAVDAGFPAGQVHLRDVAGVYPYENTLRAVRISGRRLREFLEHSARYFRPYTPGRPVVNDSVPGYNFDVVSGVAYNIDLTRPVGQRIRGLAYEGRLVQPADTFTLALNSYRQAGGGGYTMLAGAPVVYDGGENVRDLLVDEIRRARLLDAQAYYRASWSIVPPEARAAARAAFAPAAAPVNTADSTLLRVLAIADFHGQLEPRAWNGAGADARPVGGAAALKVWLDSLARACGCASVRLDAGDEMQGTPLSNLTYGRATIEALNALGIDAAAIGNHEFDWSVDTLLARMREARYKFVSANISDAAGTARPVWAEPWTLVTRGEGGGRGGAKVAVIGLTTRSTPTSTAPRNVRGLVFGDGAQAIRRYLSAARQAADFVIVAAHEGGGDIFDVARQLDSGSVDLIVAGHTHRLVDTTVNGIPVVQAGSSGRAIAVVDFVRVGGTGREVRVQMVTPYADHVKPDVAMTEALGRQRRAIEHITGRVLGRLKFPLRRERSSEYGLGRLIADAQRHLGRADVAIMNNGGIRADLPEGPVTWRDLYQVQPFQNRLQRLRVKGGVLLQALEQCVAGEQLDCHVSGVEVWYDPRRESGKRVTRARLTAGEGIDRGGTYTVAVSDFMATGGSGFGMLAAAPAQDLDLVDLDALIRYLAVLRAPVEAPADVRFHRAGR